MTIYIKEFISSTGKHLIFYEPGNLQKPIMIVSETELIVRLKELEIWPL